MAAYSASPSNQSVPQSVDLAAEEFSDGSEFSLLSSLSSGTPSVVSFTSGASVELPHPTGERRSPGSIPVGGMHGFSSVNGFNQEAETTPSLPPSDALLKLLSRATARRYQEAVEADIQSQTASLPLNPAHTPSQGATLQQYPNAVGGLSDLLPPAEETVQSIISPALLPFGQSSSTPSYTWDWNPRSERYSDEDWLFGTFNPSTSSASAFSTSFQFDVDNRQKDSDTEAEVEALQELPKPSSWTSLPGPSPPPSVLESVATIMPRRVAPPPYPPELVNADAQVLASPDFNPYYAPFGEDSDSEDDDHSEHEGGEDVHMPELGDELSRVIDRLIASTKGMSINGSQDPGHPSSETKAATVALSNSLWQPPPLSNGCVNGDLEQDEIVIGSVDKGKAREVPVGSPVHSQHAVYCNPDRPQHRVTCETESEGSSPDLDCKSTQAVSFLSEDAQVDSVPSPIHTASVPDVVQDPIAAPACVHPGRSIASILRDISTARQDGPDNFDAVRHANQINDWFWRKASSPPTQIRCNQEEPAAPIDMSLPSDTIDLRTSFGVAAVPDSVKELGKTYAAKSVAGATCGGSPRSSPPTTVPSSPISLAAPPSSGPSPVLQQPYTYSELVHNNIGTRPDGLQTPDTLDARSVSPLSTNSSSAPPIISVREGPRVRIWEHSVTYPGESSSSSTSWGTLTRSPTPGLTAPSVPEDTFSVLPVPAHPNPALEQVAQVLTSGPEIEQAASRPPPLGDVNPPPAANLTGIQLPLPTPWGPPPLAPWPQPWGLNTPGQFPPPGHGNQAPVTNLAASGPPATWPPYQPATSWTRGYGCPPPTAPPMPGQPQPTKTPWQAHSRPPLSRGPSGYTRPYSPGCWGASPFLPQPPLPQPHGPFVPPPAPAVPTSSLPWATSSLPHRPVNLPQATPGMGMGAFNMGYPWQTPGPITGFSPPSAPPPPGWTPRTAQPNGFGVPNPTGANYPRWDAPAPQHTISSRFAFPDATVCFSVQGKDYYVHRHFFEKHSPFFERLLSAFPVRMDWAIPLQQVTQVGFERLLSIFYPNDLSEPTELKTVEEWTSILELSTFWEFRQLRARAIKELSDITSPVDRIMLAQTYNVPEWILSGYRALVIRRRPVTPEEAERLGMQAILKVWQVQSELNSRTHLCPGACCMPFIDGLIKAEFGLA